jgi:hypothetical protein
MVTLALITSLKLIARLPLSELQAIRCDLLRDLTTGTLWAAVALAARA